jgi:ABC-type Fe3+/spermidine/putrescine transport system ATPase subunit
LSDTTLRLDSVTKLFGTTRAVDAISLDVSRGHVFTLLGPSGCGKTTTLRMIAGLERLDQGAIFFSGRTMADAERRIFVPPHKRNMGMVFQSYAIWPHMTVFENVAYPLQLRGLPKATISEKVTRVLDLVGMSGYADRPAPLLSGGQQQRVALSRALVYEPGLLLLDEPFSNLDAKLRQHMRVEVRLLQQRLGITVLFVTHDQIEALSMSDEVAVMNNGRVEQVGAPSELYDRPASPFVRDFLGQTVSLRGVVAAEGPGGYVGLALDAPARSVFYTRQPSASSSVQVGAAAHVSIRPEDLVICHSNSASNSATNTLRGTIEALLFIGDRYEARIGVDGGGEPLLLPLSRADAWQRGQTVLLSWPPEHTHVWPG